MKREKNEQLHGKPFQLDGASWWSRVGGSWDRTKSLSDCGARTSFLDVENIRAVLMGLLAHNGDEDGVTK